MKKILLVLFITTFLLPEVGGQIVSPGGVGNPLLWENSYRDKTTGNIVLKPFSEEYPLQFGTAAASRPVYLNTNPAYYLSGGAAPELSFKEGQIKQMTLFVVYQLQDTLKEKNIWNIESSTHTEKILTTHRLADLAEGKYMNFLKGRQKTAEIHTYQYYDSDSLQEQKTLRLGGLPGKEHLPIEHFKGLIPEVILYDRVLSSQQRAQVESYLAIKYGIPVYQGADPRDYLDSDGRVIWSGSSNKKYNKRVAGIGRDQTSGLSQLESSSSLEAGIFSLKYSHSDKVEDKNFIIWGDNGEPLELQKNHQGQPAGIAREWKIVGTQPDTEFDILLDVRPLGGEALAEEYYWLGIDQSGTGDYPEGQTQYKNLGRISDLSEIKITNHSLEGTSDNSQVLSIRTAPEVFAQVWITRPDCAGTQKGEFIFKVEGGTAPFDIRLTNQESDQTWDLWLNTNEDTEKIAGLQPGTYTYEVKDSQGKIYGETLYLESYDAPQSSLKSSYTLEEGKSLTLDATLQGGSYSYLWLNEQNRTESFSPKITLHKPGVYKLKITDGQGCSSVHSIEVKSQSSDNFKSIDLFPNPSIGGDYYLRIVLQRDLPVYIELYDISGKLLGTDTLSGDSWYMYQGKVQQQGVYYIRLQSGSSKAVRKLLVQ
jgi:hypothetical protein